MKHTNALIFGYNEYGLEIAKNIAHRYEKVIIFTFKNIPVSIDNKYNVDVQKFDLSDDWEHIDKQYTLEKCRVFCALMEESKNIFLTISLRSSFKKLSIIALAKNNEDANKLKMAGASKVIPIVETTASIITDMLKKPILTKVLHDILYEDGDLKVVQIKVDNATYFDGKYPANIDWSREHGVLILSIVHEDMSREFIYSSKAKHNFIKNGDILITVGYETDLNDFKKLIGAYT
jgi:Trk K+ transport system NAD-binding subunit